MCTPAQQGKKRLPIFDSASKAAGLNDSGFLSNPDDLFMSPSRAMSRRQRGTLSRLAFDNLDTPNASPCHSGAEMRSESEDDFDFLLDPVPPVGPQSGIIYSDSSSPLGGPPLKRFRTLNLRESPRSSSSMMNVNPYKSPTKGQTEEAENHRPHIWEINMCRNDEFVNVGKIGSGEFGEVFLCRNRLDGCHYAIKRNAIPVHGTFAERRALNEVYAHAVVGEHPHIVRYYSAWVEDGALNIQSEYCSEGNLSDWLAKGDPSRFQPHAFMLQMTQALKYLHSKHLAHLDIKPVNVFVQQLDDSSEEEEGLVSYKLGDLGHITSTLNPTHVEEGDSRFLATEVLQEDYTALDKADIFALALTTYAAATNQDLPKNGPEWQAFRNGELPDVGDALPADIAALLTRMIDPKPSRRPSAAQLYAELRDSREVALAAQLAEAKREAAAAKCENKALQNELAKVNSGEHLGKNTRSLGMRPTTGIRYNRSNSAF